MSRGGARPGAGRKSNAEIDRIRELIDTVATDDAWKKVIANLLDIAMTNKGYPAVQAAQLLCRYRFGPPVDQRDQDPSELLGPIEYIEVEDPAVSSGVADPAIFSGVAPACYEQQSPVAVDDDGD